MKNLQTPGKTERVGRYDTAALVVVMVPSVFFSGASASLTLADKLGNVICDSWPSSPIGHTRNGCKFPILVGLIFFNWLTRFKHSKPSS